MSLRDHFDKFDIEDMLEGFECKRSELPEHIRRDQRKRQDDYRNGRSGSKRTSNKHLRHLDFSCYDE